MVTRTQLNDLRFDHIVVFKHDRTIFACAKVNPEPGSSRFRTGGNGHTRIFLAFEDGKGHIYSRNGRADSWERVEGELAEDIRNRISIARNNHIPVYTLNGEVKDGPLN